MPGRAGVLRLGELIPTRRRRSDSDQQVGAAPRRRGRRARGTALVAAALLAGALPLVATAGEDPPTGQAVTIRAPGGELLASVPLATDRFAVGYRNSVYRTRAEERYVVHPDGRFEVVLLAAEQVAVLEEYYAVRDRPLPAPPGDRLDFVAPPDPARPPVFEVLHIAATDLGERTLHVPGEEPVALWRLVEDDPTVILQIEETP